MFWQKWFLNMCDLFLQALVVAVQSCSRIRLKANNHCLSITEVLQGKQHNAPYRNQNTHDRDCKLTPQLLFKPLSKAVIINAILEMGK